jgi:membrane-associated protein
MEFLREAVEVILHLDAHLSALVDAAGNWSYAVLALVIFCETGLVITPFLPGDSLLFAAGAISALGGMNVHLLAVLLIAAAIIGDAVNYTVGRYFGERIAARYIKPEYLERTRSFYARHGGKTIVLARFIPIVRTMAPFVAGMGQMEYRRFAWYNVTGGMGWVLLFIYAGYFFGNLPAVKERFSLVIVAVIILSMVPVLIEWLRSRKAPRPAETPEAPAVPKVRDGR